jgi:hypothetical protein
MNKDVEVDWQFDPEVKTNFPRPRKNFGQVE